MRSLRDAAIIALAVPLSGPAMSNNADDPANWPRYEAVNAFIDAMEAGDRSGAADLVVPLENGPRGHLKIPKPEEVYSTLAGCESYGHKYSRGDFPGAITRWQCGDKHFSLWLRPSYDGQVGKVQLSQFSEYRNPHLHGRGPAPKEEIDG